MRMGVKVIMICHELDNRCARLDTADAAYWNEPHSTERLTQWMQAISAVEAHASHGHDGNPCPGDFAQIYNRRELSEGGANCANEVGIQNRKAFDGLDRPSLRVH